MATWQGNAGSLGSNREQNLMYRFINYIIHIWYTYPYTCYTYTPSLLSHIILILKAYSISHATAN